MKSKNAVKIMKLSHLGSSPLCPVKALKHILQITPSDNNSTGITFHSFRRSGATLAFNANVAF